MVNYLMQVKLADKVRVLLKRNNMSANTCLLLDEFSTLITTFRGLYTFGIIIPQQMIDGLSLKSLMILFETMQARKDSCMK